MSAIGWFYVTLFGLFSHQDFNMDSIHSLIRHSSSQMSWYKSHLMAIGLGDGMPRDLRKTVALIIGGVSHEQGCGPPFPPSHGLWCYQGRHHHLFWGQYPYSSGYFFPTGYGYIGNNRLNLHLYFNTNLFSVQDGTSFLSPVAPHATNRWAWFEFPMWIVEYLILNKYSGLHTWIYWPFDGWPIQ